MSSLAKVPAGSGRMLQPTPVYETYWRFAHARQAVFHRRVRAEPPPWTDDPILASHRFTNAYRAADRVSQFLIRNVLYAGDQAEEEVFFRCLLFKIFNRIDTWEHLEANLGEVSWRGYSFEKYTNVLDHLLGRGHSIYSGAYIMPSPPFGSQRKHRNHLRLLERMMADRVPSKIAKSDSLESVFSLLLSYPSLGRFLAFQFAIDINYSDVCSFSEMDFVVAGPGARDGIRKCFVDSAGLTDEDIVRVVTERAALEFEQRGLAFEDLWGRPLQLIDCQNLFCEVDKYARVAHPECSGASGRTRIKQRFVAASRPLQQWYPPKWHIVLPPSVTGARAASRHHVQLTLMS
ncbi:nucleotide kinase domain-containing protein [Sorangium sp. So ce394]|uniref:nucleotide kinase domain-containing protein n=1 Tax=Sorangium sp. So ce394 TaxID=3133310 RepID=UPI003F5ADFDE